MMVIVCSSIIVADKLLAKFLYAKDFILHGNMFLG